MTAETPISDSAAIRHVIAQGDAMEYVDVVNTVRKQYGLIVSPVRVEEVHIQMQQEIEANPQPQATLDAGQTEPTATESTASTETTHLAHALHYVKSVGGLRNAKRVLAELEATLRELKD